MKLALSSLKTVDYKQLFIDHGEKVVIAVVGLMVAAVLYGSNWKATDKTPTALTDKADKARQEIEERPWPEKQEKEKAGLGQGNELAGKVAQLLTPVSASAFGIRPLNPPLHPDKTLISMPRWLGVQHIIAEAGVAELQLKPGVPPLDESFIRKTPKEKEPKGKAREHTKRRELNPPKKEKKEENDESIPDELKPKQPVGQGGFGGMAATHLGRFNRDRRDKDKGRRGRGMDEVEQPVPVRKVETKPVGRGYRFVAVRGVFPLRDQVSELARAMGLPTSQKELQGLVQFRDFKLERQTKIERQGTDAWSPWEPVDRDAVMQLLENDVNGYAPETVLYGLIDGHICMPYPDRVVGQWSLLATHPDIKEFTLSDEEVDQQVAYEWKLLEKVKKEDEKNKAPADKRGFMGVQKNMRALNARAQVSEGDEKSVREQILAQLESGNGVDKEQMNEQLAEFVRTRATPVDHYLLFRYLDLKVEAGKTYRYRVKLIVTNPFRDKRIEEVTDPSIIEGDERETEYSEPTPPVTVRDDAQFFVKRIDSRVGRPSLPSAEMDIFQWFASTGTVVNKALQTQIGQILGGRKGADVLRPAEEVFDSESVLFSTKDALVDVSSGFSLDPSLHKDILDNLKNVSSIKRAAEAKAPDEAIVVDENGELHLIDSLDEKPDYDKTKTHYDLQNKPFESLRKPANSDDDTMGRFGRGLGRKGKNDPRRQFGYGRGGKEK